MIDGKVEHTPCSMDTFFFWTLSYAYYRGSTEYNTGSLLKALTGLGKSPSLTVRLASRVQILLDKVICGGRKKRLACAASVTPMIGWKERTLTAQEEAQTARQLRYYQLGLEVSQCQHQARGH